MILQYTITGCFSYTPKQKIKTNFSLRYTNKIMSKRVPRLRCLAPSHRHWAAQVLLSKYSSGGEP